MRTLLYLIVVFVFTGTLSCQSNLSEEKETLNVLFIGNSLTYYHDMPQMLQAMFDETHPHIKVDQITFPGMSLEAHMEHIRKDYSNNQSRLKVAGEITPTEKTLMENDWDVVVLQEGTTRFLIPEVRDQLVRPNVLKIKKLVKNKDCRFILFHTWASNYAYPREYCYSYINIYKEPGDEKFCSEQLLSRDDAFQNMNEIFTQFALETGIDKSDNGNVAQTFIAAYPNIEINEDPIHPSAAGSFLNACVFYELLSGEKPSGLKYRANLDPKTSEIIKLHTSQN